MAVISKVKQVRLLHQVKLGRAISVQEVADAVGVSRERMAQIEASAMQKIDMRTLSRICNFYSVNVGDVFAYEPSESDRCELDLAG